VAEINNLADKYDPKACKHHPLPSSLSSFGYLNYNGEVYIGDVFGVPDSVTSHSIVFAVTNDKAIITVSAELHRDSLAEIQLDLYKKSQVDSAGAQMPIIFGTVTDGAGGEKTKAFLTGQIGDKDQSNEYELRFKVKGLELSQDQPGGSKGWDKASCFPVRLDLAVVSFARILLHIPKNCPPVSQLPPTSNKLVLSDNGIHHRSPDSKPYVFVFKNERTWKPFKRAVWSQTIDVPTRLHRFARFFTRLSFRFVTGPFQVLLELFDVGETPSVDALRPSCRMGCMGGTPIYNGMMLDHAMPSGFTYKVWVLAGEPMYIDDVNTQCMEFDLEFHVKFEPRLTPFELGPQAWMCANSRLPRAIVQKDALQTEDLGTGTIQGRNIRIRDLFGFPPDEDTALSHKISLEVTENSLFRFSAYKGSSIGVRVSFTSAIDLTDAVCKTVHMSGISSRQTVFCTLKPGKYTLNLFAEYPLGGLHPCDSFFLQLALKPVALIKQRVRM